MVRILILFHKLCECTFVLAQFHITAGQDCCLPVFLLSILLLLCTLLRFHVVGNNWDLVDSKVNKKKKFSCLHNL